MEKVSLIYESEEPELDDLEIRAFEQHMDGILALLVEQLRAYHKYILSPSHDRKP